MKILILKGSPRRNGSSSFLADQFTKGAQEAGHEVKMIDVVYLDIHPCTGCKKCDFFGLPCSQKDEMEGGLYDILNADMLDFNNQGVILAVGCGTPSMTKESCFPQMAYELGKRL